MPLINLVQERRLATLAREKQTRILMGALAGVSVLMLGAFATQTLQARALDVQKAGLQQQLRKLEPIKRLIDEDTRQLNALKPRLDTLDKAEKMSDIWDRILSHLIIQTPSSVWLTSVRGSGTDPKKPISVGIEGKGNDQKTIADLMLRTQAEPDLGNVTLKYTEQRDGPGGDAISFEVDGDLAATTPPPPAPKKDSSGSKDSGDGKA